MFLQCCDASKFPLKFYQKQDLFKQGAHAGLIMSYFRFYIYKAIRKVLFLHIPTRRSYKCLIFSFNATSIIENRIPDTSYETSSV